jgi:hypothetical protein
MTEAYKAACKLVAPETIDRCAQVAAQAQKPHWTVDARNIVEEIVAAIRALKDEP